MEDRENPVSSYEYLQGTLTSMIKGTWLIYNLSYKIDITSLWKESFLFQVVKVTYISREWCSIVYVIIFP
jgi:hypothetical protein